MSAKTGRRPLTPRIAAVLPTDEQPMSAEEIAMAAEVANATARKHLATLNRRGLVVEIPAHAALYYKKPRRTL